MKTRHRRRIRILVVLVALYGAIGFFALPPLIKWQLEKRATEELGRPVNVGRVRVNPFTLSLGLERVMVRMPDGADEMFSWGRFFVNFDAIGSVGSEWVLSEVALDGFHANVEVRQDGSLNFSDLLEKFRAPDASAQKPASASASRPWRLRQVRVAQAKVDFTDRSQPELFRSVIGPANFSVTDFRTAGLRGAPGRFEAISEAGEKLTWTGTLTAAPLTSVGELRVENVLLPKYAPYLASRLKGAIGSGRLSLAAAYELDLAPESRRIALSQGTVQMQDLQVLEKTGGKPLVEIARFEVNGIAADAVASRVSVDAVRVDQGKLAVERRADGSVNLLGLWSGGATTAADRPAKRADVTVKEIAVRDFHVGVRDLVPSTPAEMALSQLNASVKNFTLTPGAAIPVELTFGWEPRGTVRVAGNVTMEPRLADLDLEVAWLALPPLSPYAEKIAGVRLARGAGSMKGHARALLTENRPPDVTFSGEARLEDVSAVEAANGGPVGGMAELALADVKLATQPHLVVSVAELRLGAPQAWAVLGPDHTLNLAKLIPPSASESASPTVTANANAGSGGSRADVTVSRILLNSGELNFTDRSVNPAVQLALTQVTGTLRNVSSLHPELGSVELRAMVNGGGPVTVTGRLNPLGEQPFADVLVDGKLIDLLPAAPYVEKFAGYELERGKLFLDVRARLADDKLDMTNTVTLDQFTLGAPKPGPDAVKLPVKLGVALLKDSDGKIVLDLPVQGSLSDPQFKVGKVAGQVVTNLLTKAATSPFSLLGAMFGGGGEELAEQEFVPGTDRLTDESLKRIATVQRALAARPALSLEIEGGFDPGVDRPGLQAAKLDEQLRARAAGGAERAPLSASERANAIRQLFETRMAGVIAGEVNPAPARRSERTAAPAPLPAAEEVRAEAATPEEHRNLFGRALDIATLKGPRDWWRGRKERAAAEERAEKAREQAARAEAERIAAERAEQERLARQSTSTARAPLVQLPIEEMERRLLATISVTDEDLQALAEARANAVRERLLQGGAVAAERLAVAKTFASQGGPRVRLHLR